MLGHSACGSYLHATSFTCRDRLYELDLRRGGWINYYYDHILVCFREAAV